MKKLLFSLAVMCLISRANAADIEYIHHYMYNPVTGITAYYWSYATHMVYPSYILHFDPELPELDLEIMNMRQETPIIPSPVRMTMEFDVLPGREMTYSNPISSQFAPDPINALSLNGSAIHENRAIEYVDTEDLAGFVFKRTFPYVYLVDTYQSSPVDLSGVISIGGGQDIALSVATYTFPVPNPFPIPREESRPEIHLNVSGSLKDENCPCDGAAGRCSKPSLGSVDYSIPLGASMHGRSHGSLSIKERDFLHGNVLNSRINRRSGLRLAGRDFEHLVEDGGGVIQVLSADTLTTLTDIAPEQGNGYVVRQYAYANRGTLNAGTNRYEPVAESEFRAVTIKLEAGRVAVVEWEKAGQSHSYWYECAKLGNGLLQWKLTDDAGKVEELTEAKVFNGLTIVSRVEEKRIKQTAGGTSTLLLHEVKKYERVYGQEKLVERAVDPSGANLVWKWAYYGTPMAAHIVGRLHWELDPYGNWAKYDYGLNFNSGVTREVSWLDSALNPATGSGGAYMAHVSSANTLSTQIKWYGNVLSERNRLIGWASNTAWEPYGNGEISRQLKYATNQRMIAPSQGAAGALYLEELEKSMGILAFTRDGNMDITTIANPDAAKPGSEEHEDGTMTLHQFSDVVGHADWRQETVDHGVPDAGRTLITDGVRTVKIENYAGVTIKETQYAIVPGGAGPGYALVSEREATAFDERGRPTTWLFDDGTTEITSFGCCGPESFTDRLGVTTSYTRDAFGYINSETREGVTMRYINDALGRRVKTTREGTDGSVLPVEEVRYDLAGRVVQQWDAMGRVMHFLYGTTPEGGQMKTTVYPGGGTRVERYYRDGQLKSVTGTAVSPVEYAYDTFGKNVVYGGTSYNITAQYTEERRLNDGGFVEGWTRTYRDMLGNVFLIESSLPNGGVASTVHEFDMQGRVVKTTDPDGVISHFAYNGKGERTMEAVERSGNSQIDLASKDMISQSLRSYATHGAETVERVEVYQWLDEGSAAGTLVSQVDRSLDGRRSWSTDGAGQTTTRVVVLNVAGHGETETVTFPDGTSLVEERVMGRTVSRVRKSAGGAVLEEEASVYGDAFHRLSATTVEGNKTTEYVYFADDQVASVTGPDPDGAGPLGRVTTSYEYDGVGRRWKETLPDGGVVETLYDAAGRVTFVRGARTYPVGYSYDVQGRLKTMTTWQDIASWGGPAVTTWDYEPETGRLARKLDANGLGATYTYTAGGRLGSREWQREEWVGGVQVRPKAIYDYANGQLASVSYNDGTHDVSYDEYNRRGQVLFLTDGSGTREFHYTTDGRIESESYGGWAGDRGGFNLVHGYDGVNRRNALTLSQGATPKHALGYGYENGRLGSVTVGGVEVRHLHDAASGRLQSVEHRVGGAVKMTTTLDYDGLGRLRSRGVTLPGGGGVVRGMGYEYNAAGQRVGASREDGTRWGYGYDVLGQLNSGVRRRAGVEVLGEAFGYEHDSIGNRKKTRVNGREAGYAADVVNAYTHREVPGVLDVIGEADADALVTVNERAAARDVGGRFYGKVTVDNENLGPYVPGVAGEVKVVAVKPNVNAAGEDAVAEETRPYFIPKSLEHYEYDADGNLKRDGKWDYYWDGENRLRGVATQWDVVLTTGRSEGLDCGYDAQGRRYYRHYGVTDLVDGNWQSVSEEWTQYYYDGWNLIYEQTTRTTYDYSGGGPDPVSTTTTHTRRYAWGEDLSGSEQGAGGVGGLVWTEQSGQQLAPAYDGNGNILALIRLSDGTVQAAYEYGPFGEPLRISGPLGQSNPMRWSTKFTDETGLVYYGYRYYSPSMGRWVSRDPIEEDGGPNIYGYLGNSSPNFLDVNGHQSFAMSGPGWSFQYQGGGWVYVTHTGTANWNPTAVDLGLSWLLGIAPKNSRFGPGSIIAGEMAKTPEAAQARSSVIKLLKSDCRSAVGQSPRFKRDLFQTGYWENIGYAADFAEDLAGRNRSRAFMGSFSGSATITQADCGCGLAKVKFSISNDAGWESATRLPRWGYRKLSDGKQRPALFTLEYFWLNLREGMPGFTTRPNTDFVPKSLFENEAFWIFGSTIGMTVEWEEDVRWDVTK